MSHDSLLYYTAASRDSPLYYTAESQAVNFKFEYLGEFETEFENILGYESGAKVGVIDEKISGQKSRATVPLNSKAI